MHKHNGVQGDRIAYWNDHYAKIPMYPYNIFPSYIQQPQVQHIGIPLQHGNMQLVQRPHSLPPWTGLQPKPKRFSAPAPSDVLHYRGKSAPLPRKKNTSSQCQSLLKGYSNRYVEVQISPSELPLHQGSQQELLEQKAPQFSHPSALSHHESEPISRGSPTSDRNNGASLSTDFSLQQPFGGDVCSGLSNMPPRRFPLQVETYTSTNPPIRRASSPTNEINEQSYRETESFGRVVTPVATKLSGSRENSFFPGLHRSPLKSTPCECYFADAPKMYHQKRQENVTVKKALCIGICYSQKLCELGRLMKNDSSFLGSHFQISVYPSFQLFP